MAEKGVMGEYNGYLMAEKSWGGGDDGQKIMGEKQLKGSDGSVKAEKYQGTVTAMLKLRESESYVMFENTFGESEGCAMKKQTKIPQMFTKETQEVSLCIRYNEFSKTQIRHNETSERVR